jgi:N6-L-threonylcarbamoyladenine synthase
MNILAFETSCDETSVSVVKDGVQVLSCEIASSMSMHAQTGGIIPENAARKQIEFIIPTLEEALKSAFPEVNPTDTQKMFEHIDALAVTVGPGLIGSLLVGIETAKTLATLYQKPLIPVNHVEAHLYGTFLSETLPTFPLLALIVSGGHTDFVLARGHGDFTRIGGTRDDAAGEAFDKCARIIGLPYPGGPSISMAAMKWRTKHPTDSLQMLPRPMIHEKNIELSFSGLKTAVSRLIKENEVSHEYSKEKLAAEVEEAIVDTLVHKTVLAINETKVKNIVLCGGVSANTKLRDKLQSLHLVKQNELELHVPLLKYCTDNAAMIGSAAFFNNHPQDISTIDANPELHFI